jgi:hypothetical protein
LHCCFKVQVPLVVKTRPAEHSLVSIARQLQFSKAEWRAAGAHICSSECILPSVMLPPDHVRFQSVVHEVYRHDTPWETIMNLSSGSVLQQLQQLRS